MKNKIYLALGSNKSDRIDFIHQAINRLKMELDIVITKISSIYYTKPFGYREQENFVNLVVLLETEIDLDSFYLLTKKIEMEIGRTKSIKWGPREIDLDILLFNDLILQSEHLTIPHKEIENRDFFLVPLIEIEPDIINPRNKNFFKEHLNSLQENYILAKEIFNTNQKG
ncbi:MAG: 2-amino-4-hydroxy-6-hydroxymethyldihydropteridine diphosphokinase [Ignavibacteriales bacterium CG_4_9_14_3_um_filter_34_10]|nr:MAG: 2-amino-4-hydroxy-6-hydroxymethyldihydropteridine diphosphokinase [Ignavibacteriales bacterium CG_4_9_14_3_um_filter_34_10]